MSSHRTPRGGARPPLRLAAAAVCALFFLAAAGTASAGVTSFVINVPEKTGGTPEDPIFPIHRLKITVTLESENPVRFVVTRTTPPGMTAHTVTSDQLTPGGGSDSLNEFPPDPAPAGVPDSVSFIPPATAGVPVGDPARRKYVIFLNLDSNAVPGTTCANAMTGPETWQIQVTTASPASPEIESVCVQSFDKEVVGQLCQGTLRVVPFAEQIATVEGQAGSVFGCRPGVDVALVLDHSGSMSSPVAGDPTLSKITSLHNAVKSFVDVWSALRANESTGGGTPPDDHIGVFLFDDTAKPLSTFGGGITSLHAFNDAAKDDVKANIVNVAPAGFTSIGAGLLSGTALFGLPASPADNRKAILLMSDGMQNTEPLAEVFGGQVRTVTGGVPAPLPGPTPQIYTVTVGPSGPMFDVINQQLATATGGFFMNSETDAAVLPNLFLEVLQNFVRFSTVETLRMVSEKAGANAPYETVIPVTTTTQSLSFHLNWNPRLGGLRLTLRPPGGEPIVRQPAAGDTSGTLLFNETLPLRGGRSSAGNWGVRVEGAGTFSPTAGGPPEIPFNMIVLGDDAALNSELSSVAADYGPGDRIRLQARISELERPVLNLNGQPGARVVVEMLRPGQSLGDLLSDTPAATPSPGSPDPLTPTDAQIERLLRQNPNALAKVENTLTLLDNGSADNGDAVAGDGVYTATFPAQLAGNYHFLFGVEGGTASVGRFSRQQLRTVHVRAVPDAGATQFQSSVRADGGRGTLTINMTPRTRFNHRMGPGWANYFWFVPDGGTPVKPVDNRDGTYTATFNFGGSTPPPVRLHFLRVFSLIPDSATPDRLPVPLGGGNVLVDRVPPPRGPGGDIPAPAAEKRWGLSLHAGGSFPHGNFGAFFDPGFNAGLDLEYRVNDNFSVEGIYTFHRFPLDFFDAHRNLHQFSLNGKVYGNSAPVKPFANLGFGAYKFDPGDARAGLNVGGGLQFNITPTFAVEGAYNFHNVFTSGANARFSTVQGGVRFRF